MTNQRPEIRTPEGVVRGIESNGVATFHAIPYAAAPVADLRWRPPQAPASWDIHDGTRTGPVPPQLPSRLRAAMGDIHVPQSEDCLHLTVWTPSADSTPKPVVIWLHGGAWQSGGGALPWYAGETLARLGDVVVVGVNYRLAALGWLYVPGETANVGLLDQEAAIAWVKQNIAAFGGDSRKITLMGQSAGAGSIACMLTRGPICDRIILQSPSLGRGIRSAEQAHRITDAYLAALGVGDLDQARAMPVSALLQAQAHPDVAKVVGEEGSSRAMFGPVADGSVLGADVEKRFQAAAELADVLVGYTAEEMRAFPGAPDGKAGLALGDAVFGVESRAWAARAGAASRRAWLYEFDCAPSQDFGACHCIELPFIFGTWEAFDRASMLKGLPLADAVRLTSELQAAWIQFIREGTAPWPKAPHIHHFI